MSYVEDSTDPKPSINGVIKETYIRIDMEKGKRLSALLQPENVDAAGGYITLAKLAGGAAGGNPIGMVTAIQDMASSGLSGPPLNAGMRDFMGTISAQYLSLS